METLVTPLRSSVRTVGTAVKHMPDVAEGVGKLFNVKGVRRSSHRILKTIFISLSLPLFSSFPMSW